MSSSECILQATVPDPLLPIGFFYYFKGAWSKATFILTLSYLQLLQKGLALLVNLIYESKYCNFDFMLHLPVCLIQLF